MKLKKSYLLAVPLAATLIACNGTSSTVEKDHTVKLSAFSTTDNAQLNSISYGVNGNDTQDNNVRLPWEKTLTASSDDNHVAAGVSAVIVAQLKSGTSISCIINVDGVIVEKKTATGASAVVTCNWSE